VINARVPDVTTAQGTLESTSCLRRSRAPGISVASWPYFRGKAPSIALTSFPLLLEWMLIG
jgi:hypothetical protein